MLSDKEYRDIWNKNHISNILTTSTASARNAIKADYCEYMIIKAKKAYYDSENTIMSDNWYDTLESYLEILRPTSLVLEKVGS